MARVNVTHTYEFESCSGCPELSTGRTFGNDGRDGSTVYICNQGCFGKRNCEYGQYDGGPRSAPKVPPLKCPYIENEDVKRLASRLRISYDEVRSTLIELNLTVKEDRV